MAANSIRKHLRTLSRSVTEDGSHQSFLGHVSAENLQKYEQKLLPLLQDNYGTINNISTIPGTSIGLNHALDVPIVSITNLSVHPGERSFLVWYIISTYFPLISACLGPLANMISIIALIQHWRVDINTRVEVPDLPQVVVLNSVSLALGLLGNISLLINFSGSIKYMITQTVSICCWVIASGLLIAGIVITNFQFQGPDPKFSRSEGFWMAVFTAFYYLCCSVILIINLLGCFLKKYPPTFNLNNKQRSLMVYTVTFGIWCIIGTVIMEHMIAELTYGSSLYYCIVSFLTIGLGDILPVTTGARSVVLILSLGGVLNMGLLIAMIRQVVLSSSGPTIFWHQIERERTKELNKLRESHEVLDSEESFHKMRVIRKKASYKQLNISLATTLLIFCLYWLIGATVFHFLERWTYFEGAYFCFLCLLTIGYGDFSPASAFGRVFFVSWAISAVPLMTILISNVGDKLFEFAGQFSEFFNRFIFRKWYEEVEKRKLEMDQRENRDSLEDEVSEEEAEEDIQIEHELQNGQSQHSTAVNLEAGSTKSRSRGNLEKSSTYDLSLSKVTDTSSRTQVDSSKHPGMEHFYNPSIRLDDDEWGHIKESTKKRLLFQKNTYRSILAFLEKLKPLLLDTLDYPNKKYDHDEWSSLLDYIEKDPLAEEGLRPDNYPEKKFGYQQNLFWLSDNSPLRLPLKEPNYLVMKIFMKIESDLKDLLDLEMKDVAKLRKYYDEIKRMKEAPLVSEYDSLDAESSSSIALSRSRSLSSLQYDDYDLGLEPGPTLNLPAAAPAVRQDNTESGSHPPDYTQPPPRLIKFADDPSKSDLTYGCKK